MMHILRAANEPDFLSGGGIPMNGQKKSKALVMVVDDNADMREHIVSVLSESFDTITANNGMDALLKLKDHHPELIISDHIMPLLDGTGLVKEIRKNKQTGHIPVLILTTTAGDSVRTEISETGADGYLAEPFSANELLASVASHISVSRLRSANEQSISNLFSQMPMGIAVYRGENLVIEMVNDTMLGYWGRTREQAIGTALWELLPEGKDRFADIAREVYRAGKRFVSPEFPVTLSRNGKEETRFATFGFEPRFDEHGHVIGLFGVAHDITEQVLNRKKLEENERQLKALANDLEAKVAQRTEQLNHANEVLEAKNTELERQNEELASFSYVASHDLQEPLRKIQTFSNRIQELEKDKLSDTGKDYFNRMIAAAQRMHLLIEALLDYSRTNTSDKTLVETDIAALLNETRTNLSVLIEEKKAVIEAGPLPTIKVIPHQFQQLLANLLSNSLKYSRPGVPPHIRITAERVSGADSNSGVLPRNGRYWRFRFEDNGIGFEQQYAGKIFELFQRLHGRMEYSGTGIGLAICKKIVQNHQGFITASGEPGAGARFDVYLPV